MSSEMFKRNVQCHTLFYKYTNFQCHTLYYKLHWNEVKTVNHDVKIFS